MPERFVTHSIQLPSGELEVLQPAEAAEIPDDHQVEWAPLALTRNYVVTGTLRPAVDLGGSTGCGAVEL